MAELRHIHGLMEKAVDSSTALESATTTQILQWAISNAGQFSFNYYDVKNHQTYDSAGMMKAILGRFMQGGGKYLPEGHVESGEWNEADEDKVEAFHNAVVEQIYSLTGRKVEVQEDDTGFYVFY